MPREKTRYNKKELKAFEKTINAKLADAQAQLEFYQSALKERGDLEEAKVKGLEKVVNSAETEKLTKLASRQKKLINHLENAKLRILNGVYGVCRVSGVLISSERLKAVPHATLSIAAKEKLSR